MTAFSQHPSKRNDNLPDEMNDLMAEIDEIERGLLATPGDYGTEFHEDTIDVWVIQEGGGTLVTGGEEVDGKHRGGIERPVKVGDVIFIPAGIYHGMKETRSTTWLNIRFPEHRN